MGFENIVLAARVVWDLFSAVALVGIVLVVAPVAIAAIIFNWRGRK